MIYLDNKQYENSCQPFFENQLNFNNENQLLNDCRSYCTAILNLQDSPWQRQANLIGYWYSKGQRKISKLQRAILHYLHQWHFSKGNPAYLKSSNLAKKVKSSRRNTIRAITRLIERGILIRLEYWSDKYQRFRSVLLPKMYQTLKEKLVFQLAKRTHPFTETDTGGCVRLSSNILKSLKLKNSIIYTNILITNILLTNKPILNLISLNSTALSKEVPLNPIQLINKQMEDTLVMQTKSESKPKRLVLKVKESSPCPKNISETLALLEKNNYDINSVTKVVMNELFYFLENKIFYGYASNNPEMEPMDLSKLFVLNPKNSSEFLKKYDRKMFKILVDLYKNHPRIFNDDSFNKLVLKIMGYWNSSIKNPRDKSRKFNGIRKTLKSMTGFRCFLGIAHLLVNNFQYNKDFMESYEKIFIRAIQRYLNYSYVLNLPRNIRFDYSVIDPENKKTFENCLTMDEEHFHNMVNTSRRVFRERPENEKSLNNVKEIFVDAFYKDRSKGKQRFEEFRPQFARWLEILIQRIEKYSDNGKKVELCGLKLTAETKIDMPVIYYYFEWLKSNIFRETVFRFDEMFGLNNWNTFVKKFMRQERGYEDYWKIVDRN